MQKNWPALARRGAEMGEVSPQCDTGAQDAVKSFASRRT